jgi:hypothetical protein
LAEADGVFAHCGKFLVVLALVFSTGAHWAALQTVAWTTMLANNLRTQSVSEAVSKTFDGEHPCCLCKAIAAAKKSEKKSEAVAPVLKMEFPPVAENMNLFPPARFEMLPLQNTFAAAFSSPPPLPPPRRFLA